VRNPAISASIYSIAMSDTGKIHLVGNSTFITSSSDLGASWSPNSDGGKLTRNQIVTSKDGQIVLTGSTAASEKIRISRDGGSTYSSPVKFINGATGLATTSTPTGPTTFGMSDDGKVMAAISSALSIWISNDYGVTWADQSSKYFVGTSTRVDAGNSISISGDGNKILVTKGIQHRYSDDAGKTWIRSVSSSSASISVGRYSTDMSSDGSTIVAATNASSTFKGIVKSIDGGRTWTALTNPDPSYTLNWSAIVCSSDCSKMAAMNDAGIYFSADSGHTWRKQEKIAPQLMWMTPIVLSSDGSTLAIGDTSGKFFIGTPKP
jgi:photosystem II stability/assembly factor-like uncharacterized protein